MKDIYCTLNDEDLVNKLDEKVDELCRTGGKSFVMHVPARPNEDLDLLISTLIYRFKKTINMK